MALMNLSAAILTNNYGKRIKGRDKSSLQINGNKIIEIQLDILSKEFSEVMIIGKAVHGISEKIAVYDDINPSEGSLAGIHTALTRTKNDNVFIVSCDMPFLSAAFIRELCDAILSDDCDALVPIHQKGIEPLHAFYNKRLLTTAEALLSKGHKRIRQLYDNKNIRFFNVSLTYDPDTIFFNINTPEDLSKAQIYAERIK